MSNIEGIIGIFFTTLIIVIFTLFFSWSVYKTKEDKIPSGFVLTVESFVNGFEDMLNKISRPIHTWILIYSLYLFIYITVGTWITILGLESPFSLYSIPFSLAVVTLVISYAIALKTQRWKILFRFLNPIGTLSHLLPFFYLSVRLFVNVVFGVIVTLVFNEGVFFLSNVIPIPISFILSPFLAVILSALKVYFDLLDGIIQAAVFTLLNLVFWQLESRSYH